MAQVGCSSSVAPLPTTMVPAPERLKCQKASRNLEYMCWPSAAWDADKRSAHPTISSGLCSGSDQCTGGASTWAFLSVFQTWVRCNQPQGGWQHHQEASLGPTADSYCFSFTVRLHSWLPSRNLASTRWPCDNLFAPRASLQVGRSRSLCQLAWQDDTKKILLYNVGRWKL